MPVWFATVDLRVEHGWARPALARVTVQHHGRTVHAHADLFTIPEAVDVLALRLRGLLDRLRELEATEEELEIAPGVTQGSVGVSQAGDVETPEGGAAH